MSQGKLDHTKCGVSTGIHDHPLSGTIGENGEMIPWGLTFGQGDLDEFGYWSKPCMTCARAAELADGVALNTYWPFEKPGEETSDVLDLPVMPASPSEWDKLLAEFQQALESDEPSSRRNSWRKFALFETYRAFIDNELMMIVIDALLSRCKWFMDEDPSMEFRARMRDLVAEARDMFLVGATEDGLFEWLDRVAKLCQWWQDKERSSWLIKGRDDPLGSSQG